MSAYVASDLQYVYFLLLYVTPDTIYTLRKLTKDKLTVLIQREIQRWPGRTFNPSRVRAGDMRAALLDPDNGFSQTPGSSEPVQPSPDINSTADASIPPRIDPSLTGRPPASDLLVHLFLQDHRVVPTRRHAADISISRSAVADIHGYQLVDARELFTKLQASFSAIKGMSYHPM